MTPDERPIDLPTVALEADVHYHRERLALYRARRYGPRPTAEARVRELKRAVTRAEHRLRAWSGLNQS